MILTSRLAIVLCALAVFASSPVRAQNTYPAVEFPRGVTTVALPVRFDRVSGKFVVRVKIGERGLDFLLDSGCGGIVMERDAARSIGLSASDTSPDIVPSIAAGDLILHDVAIHTRLDLGTHAADRAIVGLLGFDFLRGVVLRLDYDAGTVTAYEPNGFSPPAGEHRIDLPLQIVNGVPETSVTIDGATGSRFAVDTGSAGALIVADSFRQRYPRAVVDERPRAKDVAVSGVGGGFTTDEIVLREIELGGARFADTNASLITSKTAFAFDEDGFIGPDFLRTFVVYLDLPREQIYLVPSRA